MKISKIIKSSQEQAIASWIDSLNQFRLDELVSNLFTQDVNLEGALVELQKLKDFVATPEGILGSMKSKHGEIAEHVQVNISNARRLIEGLSSEFTFENVGRIAPEDYLFNGIKVQSKYLNNLVNTLTSNNGILGHISKYPDFLKEGNIYHIPLDQYDHMQNLLSMNKEEINKAPREVRRTVLKLREFQKETGIDLQGDSIQPAIGKYKEVQLGTVNKTIENEETSIIDKDQDRRNEAYQKSKPSLQEGVRVTATSAAIEGGMAFCLGVSTKLKSGKKLPEFTRDDWKDIGFDTAIESGKGAIRGASIYTLTNFTATPAAVASAFVTASFGVVAQAQLLQEKKINQEDFIVNCEVICLDVSVSAISSLMGQVVIPIPVLGAIIGNTAGMFMYEIAKNKLSNNEQALIESYNSRIYELSDQLDEKYRELMNLLNDEFAKFKTVLDLALDQDVNIAFSGSIALAQYVGCDSEKILWNKQDVDAYFQN